MKCDTKELQLIDQHPELFTQEFRAYMLANAHVFKAFEAEAMRVHAIGFKHYSARTILHFLRHHSAATEFKQNGAAGAWKINNNHSPYFGRLFDLLHPELAGLWEFRSVTPERMTRHTQEAA